MWIRRAYFSWLFPAAVVLPLWLLIGWGVFQSSGWAFLWVLFIAMPSVLVCELLIGFLVLGAAFWKTRSIIVPTLLSALAYGLAWKITSGL